MAELNKCSRCSFLCCHWTAFESQLPPRPRSETEQTRYTFGIATAPCCSFKKPECPNCSAPACHCSRVLRLGIGYAIFPLGRDIRIARTLCRVTLEAPPARNKLFISSQFYAVCFLVVWTQDLCCGASCMKKPIKWANWFRIAVDLDTLLLG